MNENMMNKGYQHPIFSLDLIIDGSQSKEQQRYFISVPEGRLITRCALRARGANLTTGVCNDAVNRGLAVVSQSPDEFAPYKLDPQWSDNMRHWQGVMNDQESSRSSGGAQRQLGTQGRQGLLAQARDMWRLVMLSAELSGQPAVFAQGPPPRAIVPFIDALEGLAARVRAFAPLLAENGFTPSKQEALFAVIAALRQQHAAATAHEWSLRTKGDQLAVIRGALIGDLGRMSMLATRLLPPETAASAQMSRLLGRPRRQPGKTPGKSQPQSQPGA